MEGRRGVRASGEKEEENEGSDLGGGVRNSTLPIDEGDQ